MNYWSLNIESQLSGLELKSFINKKKIIKHLYKSKTLLSTDLMQALKISAPKANAYIQELVTEGIIESKGKGESLGGRRPNTYGLCKDSIYIVSVDVGIKFFRIAILNNDMEICNEMNLPPLPLNNRALFINTLHENIYQLIANTNLTIEQIIGIGINMPGLVDSNKGINHSYLFDEDLSLTAELEQFFSCPVFLENDTKARTIAELRFGTAKNYANALIVQVDWGLGLGMILNGKLYRGNSGFAGEFSHIPINPKGELCSCGKIGCIETMASGKALVRLTEKALQENKTTLLSEKENRKTASINSKTIIETAQKGDQLCIDLLRQVGESLGQGIAILIQILNPEIIVLGGALAKANTLLTHPIEQSLNKYCLPQLRNDAKIAISPLGDNIGIIGSAGLVLDKILNA